MDLTNIKPCVECAKYRECVLSYAETGNTGNSAIKLLGAYRVCQLFVFGVNCFEEVDDG